MAITLPIDVNGFVVGLSVEQEQLVTLFEQYGALVMPVVLTDEQCEHRIDDMRLSILARHVPKAF
jgi:hypothetical protein